MNRFLERLGETENLTVVEMGTNETIKQAVMAGLGIAIISAHTCQAELAEGKLATIPLDGLPLIRQWYLIHRSDQTLSPVADRFRQFLLAKRDSLFNQ
jgi:DNA-binding transcriptional LysR family regulator